MSEEWKVLYEELKTLCNKLGLTLTDCQGYTEDDLIREINILKDYMWRKNK